MAPNASMGPDVGAIAGPGAGDGTLTSSVPSGLLVPSGPSVLSVPQEGLPSYPEAWLQMHRWGLAWEQPQVPGQEMAP
eukprot:CAMPEP_0171681508 /NCGR_PEP_ID=MMETSP0990-20121206/57409_1 /TAXON_ID=483369 /ORGANISM="non described non described, Strain CCMP2098" /LENGTH=77 /DNA_ID=CAMNT_0012268567 /DNA_START=183 /DNA_END=417 /DNA_ORIENTATION=+